MAEDKIKPSQRKTVRDAEERRKRERMMKELKGVPESARSGMLASRIPPRSKPKSDEEFQGYLNKKIRGEIAPGAEGVYPGRIGDRFDTFMYGPIEPLPPSLRPQQRRASMKKGGSVKSKSKTNCRRGDGICKRGKTKGRMV